MALTPTTSPTTTQADGFQPVTGPNFIAMNVRQLLTDPGARQYQAVLPDGDCELVVQTRIDPRLSASDDRSLTQITTSSHAPRGTPSGDVVRIEFRDVDGGPYHFRAFKNGEPAEDPLAILRKVMDNLETSIQI